jgi:Helicase conserved C-terminal domain/Type III restriction enzyme, res subunit
MSQVFKGWSEVVNNLTSVAESNTTDLNPGQRHSLRAVAGRLPSNGVIIADEVGMGKTRIAAFVANSVIAAGGRVAILVPPGLGPQWGDELSGAGINAPQILRSLSQYLHAWESKENPCPWFAEPVVLISHAFTNWRLGNDSASWRWALLPELYARWRKHNDARWPRGYIENEKLGDGLVKNAAESIVNAINEYADDHEAKRIIDKLKDETPWPAALGAAEYTRNSLLRPSLEQAVGLGLGVFDLVIIDEAHKSRGQDSGLNRLVEHVVLQSSASRRLAMTATPVELDVEQWKQMLSRIKVDSVSVLSDVITRYAGAVQKVRQCPSDTVVREEYIKAAQGFKTKLFPYLLRRDKRQDESVKKFHDYSNEGFYAYRRETEILVETVNLPPNWKQAVCAAEALSFVTRQTDDPVAKRLRLTIGSGHGLATLIDQHHRHEMDDKRQSLEDGFPDLTERAIEVESAFSDSKRLQRAQWWQKVMIRPSSFGGEAETSLYDHPAILAAVEAIEEVISKDEKVLVFGRFTRPLRALVKLLNAREMLRCLDRQQMWPQSKVAEDQARVDVNEWPAVQAAHRQLNRSGQLHRKDIDKVLEEQYAKLEAQRARFRESLLQKISKGLDGSDRVQSLFKAFDADSKQVNKIDVLSVVARAIKELLGPEADSAQPSRFADAFSEIVDAASERDEGDDDGDGTLDELEAGAVWCNIVERLNSEYSRIEGGFARLMNGETKPDTRRFLQLAFNRKHAYPKVLVAQSMVGREGLNLHKACRTVVLLHPEWNPGVVEQQIGRVDRIGSLWQSKLEKAIEKKIAAADVPRIEIRPVIFQGTYDEKNWEILRDRWDDLRAQLHGIVISSRIAESYQNSAILIEEINKEAPNFSPC